MTPNEQTGVKTVGVRSNGGTREKEEPGRASGVEGRGAAADSEVRGGAKAMMDQGGPEGQGSLRDDSLWSS